jgi:hypothetical protein
MIADKDRVVAAALDLLVPPLDGDAEELLVRARADAGRLRAARRRRRWVAGLAFAVVALLTGAAIAAVKLNLLPFLQTHDRNSARFSVDPTRVYRGASPTALDCPGAGTGQFVCTRTGSTPGARTYLLATQVAAQPVLTRAGMLAQLAAAEHTGVGRKQVQRVRGDLARVSDEFIQSLNLIVSIETIAGGEQVAGHPDLELVPPASVPTWVVCGQEPSRAFRCRNLAASANVPVDSPIYRLQPSKDWRTVARTPGQPLDLGRLVETVLGRQPTRDETRLLLDVAEVASVHGSSSTGAPAPTVTGH